MKMLSAFLRLLHIFKDTSVQIRFFYGGKKVDPNQTAPLEQSDLGPFYLHYRIPKNISRL